MSGGHTHPSPYTVIPGSAPPRYGPVRMGLCFQFDRDFPGTLDQQAVLRDLFGEYELTPKLRWYFASRYKAYWAKEFGAIGQRNFVLISINGQSSMAFAISLLLSQLDQGRDLALTFCHEWGHLFDRYCMTAAMRAELMQLAGMTGDWFAFDQPYFDRPAEQFAWSFQRLIMPDLPPHTWTVPQMLSVLPDFQAEFAAELAGNPGGIT